MHILFFNKILTNSISWILENDQVYFKIKYIGDLSMTQNGKCVTFSKLLIHK